MLNFYSPRSSPTNMGSFNRAVFFPELSKFCAARHQVHERMPPDRGEITHLLLSVRTPYHLLKERSPRTVFDHFAGPDVEMLQSGRWKLLLDLGWEMLDPRPDIIQPFHHALAELRIPPSSVYVLNSNLASEKAYHSIAIDPKSRVNILPFPVGAFLFLGHHQALDMSGFDEFVARESDARAAAADRRTFVNFNGRMRPHRFYLAAFLLARGLIDKGFVSLLGYEGSPVGSKLKDIKDVETVAKQFEERTRAWPSAQSISSKFRQLLEAMPLELDLSAEETVKNNRYKKVTPWEIQDMDLYRRSYFSIVADTSCVGEALFVTEKVFEPLISLHPFIYMGHCGALAELRRLGFQTFEPFIDESYDREIHPHKRMGMVLGEIERLCSLPEHQLRALYERLSPRLVRNARLGRLHGRKLARKEFEQKVVARLMAAEHSCT